MDHFLGINLPVTPNKLVAFFVVVAMNIDTFKLFLPKNLIKKNTLKCTKLHDSELS